MYHPPAIAPVRADLIAELEGALWRGLLRLPCVLVLGVSAMQMPAHAAVEARRSAEDSGHHVSSTKATLLEVANR